MRKEVDLDGRMMVDEDPLLIPSVSATAVDCFIKDDLSARGGPTLIG